MKNITNKEIADIFKELADLLDIEGENHFKVRAYRNAARVIESFGRSIFSMVQNGEDLARLPAIGKEIAAKITQIVQTGKLDKLERLKQKIPDGLRQMLSIEGLGPKRVKILYDKLHITNPQMLQDAAASHAISKLPGFGPKTEAKILNGLHLLKQEGIRYLYAEAEPYARQIISYLQKAPTLYSAEAAGSFRRRKDTVGDLDILATAKNPQQVIDHFVKFDQIAKIITAGDTRSTIVLKNALQIDLRVVEPRHYGAALHYFTGSKSHVLALRKKAVERGLKINEYGIFRGDKKIAGKDETGIYKTFGLSYIEPELRENRGEFEAAASDRLPRLVSIDDIRGDLHMHSSYSDGTDNIEKIAEYARGMGYSYIALSDHGSTMPLVHGLDSDKFASYIDTIDKLNAQWSDFRILKSMEVDILVDGTLGADDDMLARLDIVIAGIHTHFSLPRDKQTKRLQKAIQNPHINIISHPTGRLIGKRSPMNLDMKQIYEASAEHNVYLEINSQPVRMDLDDIHIKDAKAMGVRFAISTDAHSVSQLGYMRYGINQARRGWLEKENIINTLPLPELLKLFKR
jgi:DNA polymerase (family 10)